MAMALLGVYSMVYSAAHAADYPSKPITIVVPYTAGGPPDVLARILAEAATMFLGQPVIVENKTGAGGNIAAQYVARSKADGYTLLMCAFSCAVSPSIYQPKPFDLVKDFDPVGLLGSVASVLVVNPNVPVRSLAELIAYARAHPGKLNAGSAGVGSSPHLAIELLKARSGAVVTHIPYKGVASVTTDLLGGQVDMLFDNLPNSLPNIRAGKVRALAVASGKRSAVIPDVPTFEESGVPNFTVLPWFGLMAPKGTPTAVLDRLNASIMSALASDSVKAKASQLGIDLEPSSRADMGSFVAAEQEKWRQVIEENHIRME
jgi:tripartite-type tricarboxylate transporter receptor subunit TctC